MDVALKQKREKGKKGTMVDTNGGAMRGVVSCPKAEIGPYNCEKSDELMLISVIWATHRGWSGPMRLCQLITTVRNNLIIDLDKEELKAVQIPSALDLKRPGARPLCI